MTTKLTDSKIGQSFVFSRSCRTCIEYWSYSGEGFFKKTIFEVHSFLLCLFPEGGCRNKKEYRKQMK